MTGRRRISRGRLNQMQATIRDRRGQIQPGGIPDLERTPEGELDDLRLGAEQYRRGRERGDLTVPVTIRLRPDHLDALRRDAAEHGFRGYQTYLKHLLDLWLSHERDDIVGTVDERSGHIVIALDVDDLMHQAGGGVVRARWARRE